MIEITKTVVVIRRHDGKYFQGCGYGGPGNPVAYWSDRIWEAKVYKTEAGARKTAKQHGGYPGRWTMRRRSLTRTITKATTDRSAEKRQRGRI